MKVNFFYYFAGAIALSTAAGFEFTLTIGCAVMGGFVFIAAFLREA